LKHPYIDISLNSHEKEMLQNLSESNSNRHSNSPILQLLTQAPATLEEESELLKKLLAWFLENKFDEFPEITQVIYQEGIKLISILKQHADSLTINAWWTMILNEIQKIRLPFAVKDGKGIHVMGFLETRVLDYKNVFIASMNEGMLPSSATSKSSIPYPVRKAYGLPCKEEQDAVTSYHFYRLLQLPKNVFLFYNYNLDELGQGEKSRFLLQLYHELSKANPKIKFTYTQIEQPILKNEKRVISIPKTEAVLAELNKRLVLENNPATKSFSASALTNYIACPLKFYFEQIAGLRKDKETEQIDAPLFGIILHDSINKIYAENKFLTKDQLKELKNTIVEIVDASIAENYRKGELSGNDFLLREVLIELINKILLIDEKNAPLTIEALEYEAAKELRLTNDIKVQLKGYIDRIDKNEEWISILDYKTGNDELKMPLEIEDIFANKKYKTVFQLLYYCYIYSQDSSSKNLRAGIYKLRSNEYQIEWLNKSSMEIDQGLLEIFGERLKILITEIFNPAMNFDQTKDFETCKFCDFNHLCDRPN